MHGEQRPLPGPCRYLSGAEPSPLQIEGWQGWRQPPSSVGEQAARPSRRSPVPTSEPDAHPAAPCPHRQSGRGVRRISSSGSTAVLRIARSRRYVLAVIETDTPWSNRRRRHHRTMPNRRRGGCLDSIRQHAHHDGSRSARRSVSRCTPGSRSRGCAPSVLHPVFAEMGNPMNPRHRTGHWLVIDWSSTSQAGVGNLTC